MTIYLYFYGCFNDTASRIRYNIEVMNLESSKTNQTDDHMCVMCKKFFGNQAFGMMCSQCYKKYPFFYTDMAHRNPSLPNPHPLSFYPLLPSKPHQKSNLSKRRRR